MVFEQEKQAGYSYRVERGDRGQEASRVAQNLGGEQQVVSGWGNQVIRGSQNLLDWKDFPWG